MNNQQHKPTFNVEAIMTNAHDGYRQEQIDKAKIHQLNCMLDDAYEVCNSLRSQIIDLEADLATVQERRLTDREHFIAIIAILAMTVFFMTLIPMAAVSF